MSKVKSLLVSITGDVETIGSERYFVTITCFTASVFLFFLCIIHVIMGLSLPPVFIAGGASLIILGLYFLVRFGTCLFYPKLILSILGLVLLDLTWYSKFLSNGPVLFFILIFAALVLWVWEGRSLAMLMGVYYLNIALLFFIDYRAPQELLVYPDDRVRSVDIYLSFTLYSTLLVFLLYVVKRDFIRKRDKAVHSDKLKSAFLANMSHEIRTPMNAIVGFSNLVQDNNDPEQNEQYISIIQNNSETLMRLINDIVDLSKIEAGDLVIHNADFSIRALFEELSDYYYIDLQKRGKQDVNLVYELPDENEIIHGDYTRLKQILSNLLSNAVKFTSEGSISYRYERQRNNHLFAVSDTGTGIPEEDQEQIFKRFTSYNYQGRNTEGSGIGLSIVSRIVAILKGRIWLSSILGHGSTFYISIPHLALENRSKPSREVEVVTNKKKSQSRRSILIVDDDKASQALLSQILKPLGIKIYKVSDGAEAIQFITSNPGTNLVLMDLKLPEVDGYEATKAIKKLHPNTLIIAQTAFAMEGDRVKVLSRGFDDFITKPVDATKLLSLIKTILPN